MRNHIGIYTNIEITRHLEAIYVKAKSNLTNENDCNIQPYQLSMCGWIGKATSTEWGMYRVLKGEGNVY